MMFAETSLAVFSQNRAYNEEIRQSSSPTSSATAISRKRTNAEIYSTEPDAPSPHSNKMSVNERPRTAPEQNQKFLLPSCFEQNGFPKDITGPKLQSSSSTSATMSTKPFAASIASAANAAAGIQQSFVARLQERQAQLDREYDQYEQDLENRDHTAHIEPYDWENLEGRYLEEMKSAIEEEQEIQKTITERYRVCFSPVSLMVPANEK